MKIRIFKKENCPFCEKAQEIFMYLECEYVEEHVLGKDFTVEQFKEEYGADATFPQCWVALTGEEFTLVGGAKETISFLQDHGKLSLRV